MRGGNAPLWFLTSMFTAYFFVWFLLKTDKYRLYVACVYILITYGLSFLPILMPWSLDTAFLMAVFIWIGTCLKNIDMNHWSRWFYFIMVIIYAALCTLNGEPNLSVRVYARSILLILITGTIGTILVIAVSKKLEHTFVKKMLIVLGQHSMVVFCFQMLLLRIQNDILFKIMQIPLNIYTLYLTSILKTIIAAMLGVYISKVLNRILPKIFY